MEQQAFNYPAGVFPFSTQALRVPHIFYRAAVYLRLSKDDDQQGDSVSIRTQRMMLEKFCTDQGFHIYDVYIDDGFSGLNYNRPDFQRMLEDIEKGHINLVITKDLSRLGRDYIQTGYYTEIYFQEKKVRYIALNDGIDTLKPENDIAPFKNILNDMYAKDLSRKVKTAKRQRAMNGYFISGQTPYGYKKNPDNKNQLVIDEEPAEVIRKIFQMAMEGISLVQICKNLSAERILIPSAYKAKNGDTKFSRYSEGKGADFNYTWKFATVRHIVQDCVYVGDMENRKYEVGNYKTKKRVAVPKDQHIIVRDTHEPIISREDFERVQRLVKARHTPPRHNYENIFRSIVFCAECGHKLTMATKNSKRDGSGFPKSYYRCMYHYSNPDKCTHYNSVYYEDLYDLVWKKVRALFKKMRSNEQVLENIRKKEQAKNKSGRLSAEKAKIDKRLEALTKIMRKLYEDYACEVLDAENYRSFLQEYQQEQKTLSERLDAIAAELSQKIDFCQNLKKLQQAINGFLNEEKLTAAMLHQIVERIEVEHVKEVDGVKTQEINIIYRFIETSL